jgi:hypothetical protein
MVVPLLSATSLLSLGLFQACQTSPPAVGSAPRPSGGSDPLVWEELENVEINPPGANTDKQRKAAFKRALRHSKRSATRFCVRSGNHGRACENIPHPPKTAAATGDVRTEQIIASANLEKGGGDDGTMEAIHVAQRVSFDSAEDKTAFMTELGLQ